MPHHTPKSGHKKTMSIVRKPSVFPPPKKNKKLEAWTIRFTAEDRASKRERSEDSFLRKGPLFGKIHRLPRRRVKHRPIGSTLMPLRVALSASFYDRFPRPEAGIPHRPV